MLWLPFDYNYLFIFKNLIMQTINNNCLLLKSYMCVHMCMHIMYRLRSEGGRGRESERARELW